jgi:exonuclease III
MNLLTYNFRGLASSLKKLALKRLVLTNQPDIVLLQETLSDEEVATKILSTLLPGWAFMGQSPKGRSGELVIGWRSQKNKTHKLMGNGLCLRR